MSNTHKFTQEGLDKLKTYLDDEDRGGFYFELYNQTGLKQPLIQASITTYSGVWGGMAVTTNAMAKESNPDKYNLTLDQFSLEIVTATYAAAVLAHAEDRELTEMDMMVSDHSVWEAKGMGEYFPGNMQFALDTMGDLGESIKDMVVDIIPLVPPVFRLKPSPNIDIHEGKTVSQGTLNSAIAGIQAVKEKLNPSIVLAHEIGKRYDEFCDLDKYIKDDGSKDGILKVFNREDGHLVYIQDMNPPFPYNILPGFSEKNFRDNPSEREVLHRDELWNYTQSNQPEDTTFIEGQKSPKILDEGLKMFERLSGREKEHISDNCKVQEGSSGNEFDSLSTAQDIANQVYQAPNQDVNKYGREID